MKPLNVFPTLFFAFTLFHMSGPQVAGAGENFSEISVKETRLTSSLYMLEGAGGNITASIGTDGVLLVDDDFAPMADKLVSKLNELGGGYPRFIVNTHFHYDHTGGNEVFGSKAVIVSATAVRNRLMTEQLLWKAHHPAVPAKALPTVTFENSMTLHLNDDDVRLVHYHHGHTDGDTVVFFENGKVVSMGDLYFSGMYPIFHPEHAGSLDGYVRNIEKILKEIPADAKVVPGHGPISTKQELQRYHRMIVASIATVRNEMRAGRTLEQIQKAGLAPEWASFGRGYLSTDKWLASIYKSLSSDHAQSPRRK